MKKKISVSWSGGKDSAFALYKILLNGDYEVVSLHTVFNSETKRVGMHGVSEVLIEKQSEQLGIPLEKLFLDSSEDHNAYTRLMKNYYTTCSDRGIEAVVFGDIFLEDLKKFRDDLLDAVGLKGIYPLWKIDSKILIEDFLNVNFKTLICAANAKFFSAGEMGKTIDHNFISTLPPGVDACGENGEFHTFVFEGPIFNKPIDVSVGGVVEKIYTYNVLDEDGNHREEKTSFLFCELNL